MRSAGCIVNDIVIKILIKMLKEQKIDQLASGKISVFKIHYFILYYYVYWLF